MLVEAGITLVCIVGVVFYLRFLIALKGELRHRSSGYWVRVRFDAAENKVGVSRERQEPESKAA